jgi:uncharacterized Zn-binding protein involved in type VI secretion
MAKNIVLLGDGGTHLGAMITATGGIQASGKPVCVKGDIYRCGSHGNQAVDTVASKIKARGKAIVTTGDMANCGCILTGSSRVKAG